MGRDEGARGTVVLVTRAADGSGLPSPRSPHTDVARPSVEVRRSARRRRTVSAYRHGDRVIVLMPARLSAAEEQRWVAVMVDRLARRRRRREPAEPELMARAEALSRRYLGGAAVPASVRWVANQEHRWGSCTVVDATIRVSSRLRGMPEYVLDYVLVHELAHLVEPGHTVRFWQLVSAYPRAERARGFLDGVAAASGLEPSPFGDSSDDPVY